MVKDDQPKSGIWLVEVEWGHKNNTYRIGNIVDAEWRPIGRPYLEIPHSDAPDEITAYAKATRILHRLGFNPEV